jgi:hypothetical protein
VYLLLPAVVTVRLVRADVEDIQHCEEEYPPITVVERPTLTEVFVLQLLGGHLTAPCVVVLVLLSFGVPAPSNHETESLQMPPLAL